MQGRFTHRLAPNCHTCHCTLLTTARDTMAILVCGAGGLSDGITALQRLVELRLENVLTEPLKDAVSALTNLTYISLHSFEYWSYEDRAPLLPAAASTLTGLQKLDTALESTLPPALEALTGMHTATRPSYGSACGVA
jgi:hypothetical protein